MKPLPIKVIECEPTRTQIRSNFLLEVCGLFKNLRPRWVVQTLNVLITEISSYQEF